MQVRIDSKFEQVERLREMAARRTAAYGHGARGGSGANSDRMADVAVRLMDAERELDAEIDALVDARREIETVIARVPDERRRTVLELRYLEGLKWDAIAGKMNYCLDNVMRLHREALAEVSNQMQLKM